MPTSVIDLAKTLARYDRAPGHRRPGLGRAAVATAASIGLCLLADALLARIGVAIFPATRGYVHFQFADYAKLTVIGVIIAGAAWPVVASLTSQPRWVFTRMALGVTAVLLLPDLYIWLRGQPGRAVLVLVLMHLAIALITYNVLVRLAPVRRPAAHAALRPDR